MKIFQEIMKKEKKKKTREIVEMGRVGEGGEGRGSQSSFSRLSICFRSAVRKIKSSSITTLEVIMNISEATLAPAISSTRTAVFA